MKGGTSATTLSEKVEAPANLDRTIDRDTRLFYRDALRVLIDAKVPYLLGGAFAFGHYTGIVRDTKDLDVFLKEDDYDRASGALRAAGYEVDLKHPHWLGKAIKGEDFVDLIFGGGNGVAKVDDVWFENARKGQILDIPVKLIPPEEMIWSKAFIMERERFDGGDVAHIIRSCHASMDWDRLLQRFSDNWRVLLVHFILFGYVYPGERDKLPANVMARLVARLTEEEATPVVDEKLCRGTLLSRAQYLEDVLRWGYRDARLEPDGEMTAEEIADWTAAIDPPSRT